MTREKRPKRIKQSCRYVLMFVTIFLLGSWFKIWTKTSNKEKLTHKAATNLCNFEVILILGGGKPSSKENPPEWVKLRAQEAAKIYFKCERKLKIICLSGGSAHTSQLIDQITGLPIFESQVTANYLMKEFFVKAEDIFFETSSYDTLGNAFFSRTAFVDVQKFQKLLVITSDFHFERTKFIFDWIYKLSPQLPYEIRYLATENLGLSDEAIQARNEREKGSLEKLKKLKQELRISSLAEFQIWLSTKHDLYSVNGFNKEPEVVSNNLKKSYDN